MYRYIASVSACFIAIILLAASSLAYSSDPSNVLETAADIDKKTRLQENLTEVHEDGELVLTVLTDKVHVLTSKLKSKTAFHYYSFSSIRGQDVILTTLGANPTEEFWKIEYLKGEEWILKTSATPTKLSGLGKDGVVIIRVSFKDNHAFEEKNYELVFGSYPVLISYELQDESDVNRIPPDYSTPSFFRTQAYRSARLEARFTDTRGAPLEGAVGRFILNLKESRIPLIIEHPVSDASGRISKLINFDRCAGGHQAQDYVRYYRGVNTWRSYYYVGMYLFSNRLLGEAGDVEAGKDKRTFGHICTQQLVKSVPGPA